MRDYLENCGLKPMTPLEFIRWFKAQKANENKPEQTEDEFDPFAISKDEQLKIIVKKTNKYR